VKSFARIVILVVIAGGVALGLWLAGKGTSPGRRNLDALVTVGGDAVRDVLHPTLDLTRLSEASEVVLGTAIDAQVRAGMEVGSDPAMEAYLAAVLARFAGQTARRAIPYKIALVRSAEVNAFAVAGGHIYITEGMMRFLGSEAELAAVIGHEVSHVDLRHCVERLQLEQAARRVAPELAAVARLGYEIALLGFAEELELEADRNGALLAGRALYDPWAACDLFARLVQAHPERGRRPTRNPVEEAAAVIPEALGRYLATHPPADQRIEAVRRALVADPPVWRDKRRYVGRSNFEDRRPMSADDRRGEWIVRARPPG
jgi:predicted Zn-dependent protease